MAMQRSQFGRRLEQGIDSWFGMTYDEHPQEWKECFQIVPTKKAWIEDSQMVGFGPAPESHEGRPYEEDAGEEGWRQRYVILKFALGFQITEEMRDDDLYGSIIPMYSSALADAFVYTKEIIHAAVFNDATSTAAKNLGGDGKPLLATDHPLVRGGTFSNKLAVHESLSEASIEKLVIMVKKTPADNGQLINAYAEKLLVPTQEMFAAERIMASMNRVGTANNDINALKSMSIFKGGYKVMNWWVDPEAYFIKTNVRNGLKHVKRRGLQRKTYKDPRTGNWCHSGSERYDAGHTDPRAVFGSAA